MSLQKTPSNFNCRKKRASLHAFLIACTSDVVHEHVCMCYMPIYTLIYEFLKINTYVYVSSSLKAFSVNKFTKFTEIVV